MKLLAITMLLTAFTLGAALTTETEFVGKLSYKGGSYYITSEIEGNVKVYNRLKTRLAWAKPGQRIHIVVTGNKGGYVSTLLALNRAIKKSRAKVVLEVRGYAGSAAALLLMAGNTVIVNKNARIMFHQFHDGKGGRDHEMYSNSVYWHARLGVWDLLTKYQQKLWHRAYDVTISGKQMCKTKRLIKDFGNYCVIRGTK